MEAVPRLPMISFDLKLSPENVSFAPKLKYYIAEVYHEDPESYSNEIRNLEALRASAIRPVNDVTGCQTLKRYFCQLHFLQSRFPMSKGEPAAVTFSWRDIYASMVCSVGDIRFELVSILYNIGALHTQLGATDSRNTSDGMKMACTHFQCAAWAFQYLKQTYPQPSGADLAPEVMNFMYQLCLAQAQECILEKSMMDNRKATIIAKVAVQVVDYYNQALNSLQIGGDEGSIAETIGSRVYKDWTKYLRFKVAYHSCIALLYHGQQAEEQQKMGERVAFYQAACQELENARKLSKGIDQSHIISEALAFTMDVVEGKRKAAKNENEFIYHEEVPDKDVLQQVKGASLVKGIPFSFNDPEVSGPDIFARLVPMQAHEASSVYSEEKAQLLRSITTQVEEKDNQLSTYMNSLQLDPIKQAIEILFNGVEVTTIPQEIVDRAAALSARTDATKDLVQAMATLANTYHDVESMLEEANAYLKEEESKEKEYQIAVGPRPTNMVITELKREAGKYSEAHAKASESNQTLHRAMTLHVNNLKMLTLPFDELRQHIPVLKLPNSAINEEAIKELHMLLNKIEEMRQQRSMLVNQLRDSVSQDDVTNQIITKPSDQPLNVLFEQEMQKHQQYVKLIEQNLIAQENILKAMTDTYARHSNTRKILSDIFKQRETTIVSLCTSYDAYDDLLGKANKGIEFYKKLEINVTKLLQRLKSTCKVINEEREAIFTKNKISTTVTDTVPKGSKLKDYIATMKSDNSSQPFSSSFYNPTYDQSSSPQPNLYYDSCTPVLKNTDFTKQPVIPSIRPAPVGSEGTNEVCTGTSKPDHFNKPTQDTFTNYDIHPKFIHTSIQNNYSAQSASDVVSQPVNSQIYPTAAFSYNQNYNYPYLDTVQSSQLLTTTQTPHNLNPTLTDTNSDKISDQMAALMVKQTLNKANEQLPYAFVTQGSLDNQQTYITNQASDRHNISNISYPQGHQQPGQFYSYGYSNIPASQPSSIPISSTCTQLYPTSSVHDSLSIKYVNQDQHFLPSSSYSNIASNQDQTYIQGSIYPITAPDMSSVKYANKNQLYTQPSTMKTTQDYTNHTGFSVPSATSIHPYTQDAYLPYQIGYPKADMPQNMSSQSYTFSIYSQPQYSMAIANPTVSQFQSTNSEHFSMNYSTTPSVQFDPNTNFQGQYWHPIKDNFNTDSNEFYQGQAVLPSNTTHYTSAGNYSTEHTESLNYNTSSQTYSVPYGSSQQISDSNNYLAANTYSNVESNIYHQQNLLNTNVINTNVTIKSDTKIPTQVVQNSTKISTEKKSNIDLLADIDFNISQAPLIPHSQANNKDIISIENKEIKKDSQKSEPNSFESKKDQMDVITTHIPRPLESTKFIKRDPLADPELLNQFTQEVEKFEKFVEGLTNKTLNGPTPLDLKWKELLDMQEKDSVKHNISVARCYPMKNRFSDILPYDYSRVELPSTKDDYINASHIKSIGLHIPPFIVTQAPLPSTFADFWTMVWEQQSEVIVCLLNDSEMKNQIYWPNEKGKELEIGKMKLTLESFNIKNNWTERIIAVCMIESRVTRFIVHLQFTTWPGSSFPASPGPLLGFCCEIMAYYNQQRSSNHPIVVHCEAGIGRSGLICVLAATVIQPAPLPDIVKLVAKISQQRKQILRDREHLKFTYQAVLYHSQDLLMKQGILTSRSSFEDSTKIKTHTRHPSQDLLVGPGQLQPNIEYPANQQSNEDTSVENLSRRGSNFSQSSILSGRNSPTDSITKLKGTTKKQFSSDSIIMKPDNSNKNIDASSDPLNSLDPLWSIKKK